MAIGLTCQEVGASFAVLLFPSGGAIGMVALRRQPAATSSILMSLSPAITTTAEFVILGQRFTWMALVAIGIVVAASFGTMKRFWRH